LHASEAIVRPVEVHVVEEERYWYPDDGGIVWVAGFQLVDPASGRYLGRDAPEVAGAGLRVAGAAGAARFHDAVLQSDAATPGRPVLLRRDPANEHDPNAIAVDTTDGGQLGWVPRELAVEVAAELDAGHPWSALVLREQRASPRDPRTGVTLLLAPGGAIGLVVE
jgi:HIRAN domain-containing protein